MGGCRVSFKLTEKQKEEARKTVEEIRSKHAAYEHITCESSFDAGVYFEPSEKELQEIELE